MPVNEERTMRPKTIHVLKAAMIGAIVGGPSAGILAGAIAARRYGRDNRRAEGGRIIDDDPWDYTKAE
jgi:hypothetical protein